MTHVPDPSPAAALPHGPSTGPLPPGGGNSRSWPCLVGAGLIGLGIA